MKLKRGKKPSVRVFGTIRANAEEDGRQGVAQDGRQRRCFTILTLTLISEVYISDSALRQPKDSGQRKKCSWHVCARVITMSVLFRHAYLQQLNRTPAPVNRWGVWLPARVGLGLKTAVKRDAVLCGATCRKIFVFPTYESVCV